MKKFLVTAGKTVVFFLGSLLLAGLLPLPDSDQGAVWRFWAELIPLVCICAMTAVFLWIDRKHHIKLHFISNPANNVITGLIAGIAWIGAVAAIFLACGIMKIGSRNTVPLFWLWTVSVLLNAIMQELLVRGYLYRMLREQYRLLAATIVTTALFTFMHAGAFEAGLIPVLNVISMSILMTCVLEYTDSLAAPILMHFIWNYVGAVILGGVSLADDYPRLCNTDFVGNVLLAGGAPKMEGSILVLFVNCILICIFVLLKKKKTSHAH